MFMSKIFQKRFSKNRSGFTLVELMIVIAIIGILAIVLIPQAAKMRENAKLSGVEANMRMVQAQIEGIIDNFANAGDLATALDARLGTSIVNPFDNTLTTVLNKSGLSTGVPSGADFTTSSAVVVVNVNDDPNKYFAKDGTSAITGVNNLKGTVVVAVTGDGPTLKAHIYGYDKEGKPRTVSSSVKTVEK